MAADFYEELTEVLRREAARRPGMTAAPETMRRLMAPARPAAPVPPPRPAAAPAAGGLPARAAAQAAPGPRDAAPPPPSPAIRSASLEELRALVLDCRGCPLAAGRTRAVFGEGNPHAELMFIGEGPGADEDLQGRPFVGRAGQLLDRMIAAMQFSREEVYIANVVKCRPPNNRVPTPDEAACCLGYLRRQIELVSPKVIVLLGATAARFLMNTTAGIMRLRGNWMKFGDIPVMPTFHPAFLLRQESAKREAWHDLQQVMARFGRRYPGRQQQQ